MQNRTFSTGLCEGVVLSNWPGGEGTEVEEGTSVRLAKELIWFKSALSHRLLVIEAWQLHAEPSRVKKERQPIGAGWKHELEGQQVFFIQNASGWTLQQTRQTQVGTSSGRLPEGESYLGKSIELVEN